MTDTRFCRLADCRNSATLIVALELPTDWSESREYSVRTLHVAVCEECAVELEAYGRALLDGRVGYARLMEREDDRLGLGAQLVALIEAVGPPFEPVHGGTFAAWLSRLDKPGAQAAWRLLGFVKRKAVEGGGGGPGRPPASSRPGGRGRRGRAAARPIRPSPGGGDDAA